MNTIINKSNDENEILCILSKLSDCFFDKKLNNSDYLKIISRKFAAYAKFYYIGTPEKPEAFVSFYANDKESGIAYLSMIIVGKETRGKGVGRCLINKAIVVSRNENMSFLKLEVNKENKNAIQFYERLGFKNTGVESPESYFYIIEL